MNLSDLLARRIVRNKLDALRFAADVRRRVLAILDAAERDLVAAVANTEVLGPGAQQRVNALLGQAERVRQARFDQVSQTVATDLADLAELQGPAMVGLLNKAVGAEVFVQGLSAAQLRALAGEALINGAPSAEWWSRQSADLLQAFQDQMRLGVARGESIQELVWRVRGKAAGPKYATTPGIMDISRSKAENLVRTSVMTVANEAHLDVYRANSDLIKGIQWIATLDTRTCPICRPLDGKAWDLEGAPIGNGPPYPGPLAHWACRCTQIPLTKSWEELARDAHGDSSLGRKLDQLAEENPGGRASMDGQVAGDLTYEDWLKEQKASRQEEILGPARYELWKKGSLSLAAMLDQRGRPLTLEQLRARA